MGLNMTDAAMAMGQGSNCARRMLAGLGMATVMLGSACTDDGNQANQPVKNTEAKIEPTDTSAAPNDEFDLDAFLAADIKAGAADVAREKRETAREKQETAESAANLAREKQETAAAEEIRKAAEKAEDPQH